MIITKQLSQDIIAGFSVFLLALPLCLGIAVASNAPPISGVLSAMVGGIVVSFVGGAPLTIKGPAAGLIVIILGAIVELGNGDLQAGYVRMLAVGVIAASLQILLGTLKKAEIAEVVPPSVIHGMLTAIGVIIISKQIYVMMGISPPLAPPLSLLAAIPFELSHINPLVFGFGLLSLSIAIIWPMLKKISLIPSTVVILLIVIPLSFYFKLAPQFLINLPQDLGSVIHLPDFSYLFTFASLKYIILFTLIGSIESLLTVCAIDTIAPKGHSSDLNKDLRSVGIGNLVSALIGGLPMISEIVRSKANVDYGATSVKANFFHGLFMLIAVIFFSNLINLIPLAALAALLVFVGLKLASPKEFIHAYRVGVDQFIIFLFTFFLTLITDLLIGLIGGILIKIIILLFRGNNLIALLKPTISIQELNHHISIQIQGPLTFIGYMNLKRRIKIAHLEHKDININLDAVTYIDHTVLNKFQSLSNEFSNIKIVIEENPELTHFYHHPLSAMGKKGGKS